VARRVLPVLLCVAAFYVSFVALRLEQHNALWFVQLGSQFLSSAHSSTVITPKLQARNALGYDGQYYFGLAADPAHAHDYMGSEAGIVYARVFYPAVSRATSGGSVTALPYAMLIVNLVAVLGGTAAVALWLARRGMTPWASALYGLYPGLVVTVFRDLTEPLAFGLAAIGMLVLDGSVVLSAVVFALAVLTRETIVPFALAAALIVALRSSWRRGLLYAVATCGPLAAWRLGIELWLGKSTQEVGHERGWILPLHGIWSYWPFDNPHWGILLTVTLPALAALAGAVLLLRRDRRSVVAWLLVVNVLLYVVWLPRDVYIDYSSASRAAIGVVLASLYCLPSWWSLKRARAAVAAGAVAFSLAWYLVAAALLGLAGIGEITM
jgi:hypothetical protein